MELKKIYQFFETQPPTFLGEEPAVGYILSVLLQGESYATELIERLKSECPSYRLSDTILYSALNFLESSKVISAYRQKVDGRGRPRRMYRLNQQWVGQAAELASFWQEYSSSSYKGESKVGKIEPRFNHYNLIQIG